MIFILPTLKDVMSFPSHCAKLRAARGDAGGRIFYYEITMDVDVEKALYNDGLTVIVDVLPKKPTPVLDRKPKKIGSARSFTRSTKTLEKTIRKAKKKNREKIVKRTKLDLTKYVNNKLAKLIKSRKKQSKARAAAGKKTSSRFGGSGITKKSSKSISTSKLASTKRITAMSPLSSAKSTLAVSSSISPRTVVPMRKMSKSFISSKKDPAQIARMPITRLPSALGQKAQSLLFTPAIKKKPEQTYKITTKKKEIKFRVVIQEKALGSLSTYYLRATLKDDKGVKLSTVGTIIQHAKIVNDFLTPRIEPTLETSFIKAGQVSIGVKQIDKKAKHIRVFRRIGPAETGGSDGGSSWLEILDTPLSSDDEEVRFKDEVASPRPLMYRALCFGENMRPAEDFASSILLPLPELKLPQTTALSAVGTILKNGAVVSITVSDFPDDAVSVMVRRYDLTINSAARKRAGTSAGFSYVGKSPQDQTQFVVGDEDNSVTFIDQAQKTGHDYRYVPIATTIHGKEIVGTDALIEIPESAGDDEKVELSTPSPVVSVKSQIAAVTFDLSAEFTDFGFGEIKASLQTGDQKSLFENDLEDERSNFADLINFLVERENFVSGEVESFGVNEAGTFEDNVTTQASNNVKPLELGVRYGYKVTALVRSAESMFPKLKTSEENSASLLKFQRQVGKFRNPLALRKGTLQSTARQNDMTAPSRVEPTDPFLAGRTTVQSRVEVAIPIPQQKGHQVRTEDRGTNMLVSWSYFGRISDIDHFQVFICWNGGKQMLGTVHPDSATANFSFRHFIRGDGFSVTYFYEIHSIKLNYKLRSKIRSANVVPKSFNKMIKQKSRSSKRVVKL